MATNTKTPTPNFTLASLPSPVPPGSIQFFDGYFPALPAGNYSIGLQHEMSGASGVPGAFNVPDQTFSVVAPEFFIDTSIIQTFYPPQGGSDQYSSLLPFLVMTDPSLPWERSLVPGSAPSHSGEPTPWMALVIFAESEIIFPAGSTSGNPISTGTVSDLLAASTTVLKPTIPLDLIQADLLSSSCQSITIPGSVFNAVMPDSVELSYMAHCRGVNTLDEGEQLLSVMLCNRMPVVGTGSNPAPVRYFANLVSLEGFAAYLGPNATPIPNKPSGGLCDVQVVSLFSWSFVSQPDSGQSFEALVSGLIQSEAATGGALSLPVTAGSDLPPLVADRLNDGFVPLTFISGSGDESFAWYRGPFSAVPPQPLPPVGNPPVPVLQASGADALMIYLSEQGLFDLSYASAWNIGRNLALADSGFVQNISAYRQASTELLNSLAQRMSMPHFTGEINAKSLLKTNASRKQFSRMMSAGLGKQWTNALAAVKENPAPATSSVQRMKKSRSRLSLHPREVLAMPGVTGAMTSNLGDHVSVIKQWLKNLSLLQPIPFSYLVPNPAMLPVESIRFFYLDPNWTEAMVAGAMSIAIQNSKDAAIYKAMLPAFMSGSGGEMSGMLIRSQLVSGWPQLVISPTFGGAPMNIVRNDCPATNVRLVLFDGIPDTVTLSEPYQGLLFGVEDFGVAPRCVTSTALTGAIISNAAPVTPSYRTPATGSLGGVLDIDVMAPALQQAAGVLPFSAGAVVNWNGTALTTTFVAANQLTALVPASLVATVGTASVTVSSGGATSLPSNFHISAPFELDSINPTMMLVGSEAFTLTVSGVGFASDAQIQWNGVPLKTIVISTGEATALIPATSVSALGSAAITVLSGGTTSNSMSLSIVGGDPVINTLLPAVVMEGGTGFTLTLMGSGFTDDAVVQWNSTALSTTFATSEQLSAAVPASLITNPGSISVTVLIDGTASPAVVFTIADQTATIGSLQPPVALAGGSDVQLTIDGVGFAQGDSVQWNGTKLTTTFDSTEQLTATVPSSLLTQAGTATVTVLSGTTTSNAANFTVIVPQPAIGLLEPSTVIAGAAQFTLTVTGGFGAGDFALQMVAAPELQSFTL